MIDHEAGKLEIECPLGCKTEICESDIIEYHILIMGKNDDVASRIMTQ